MKKLIVLLLALSLLVGCSQNSRTKEVSLNAYLLQNTETAAEELRSYISNESIISFYTPSDETHKNIRDIEANLQGEPNSAVILTFAPGAIDQILDLSGEETVLTEQEEAFLSTRFLRAVPSMINGQTGAEMLAASSIMATEKSSMSHSQLEKDTAIIFLYEDNYGVSAVFIPSEDGTVLISVSCLRFPEGADIKEPEQLITMMEEVMGVKLFDAVHIEYQEMKALLEE